MFCCVCCNDDFSMFGLEINKIIIIIIIYIIIACPSIMGHSQFIQQHLKIVLAYNISFILYNLTKMLLLFYFPHLSFSNINSFDKYED